MPGGYLTTRPTRLGPALSPFIEAASCTCQHPPEMRFGGATVTDASGGMALAMVLSSEALNVERVVRHRLLKALQHRHAHCRKRSSSSWQTCKAHAKGMRLEAAVLQSGGTKMWACRT